MKKDFNSKVGMDHDGNQIYFKLAKGGTERPNPCLDGRLHSGQMCPGPHLNFARSKSKGSGEGGKGGGKDRGKDEAKRLGGSTTLSPRSTPTCTNIREENEREAQDEPEAQEARVPASPNPLRKRKAPSTSKSL